MASSIVRNLGKRLAPRIAGASSSFHSSALRGSIWSAGKLEIFPAAKPSSSPPARDCSSNLVASSEDPLPPTLKALRNPTANIIYDECQHPRYPPGTPDHASFVYFVTTGARFAYATAIRLFILKFIVTMNPSKDVLALSSLEVDLSNIDWGQTITVKWRGKPVFVRRRTEDEIATATSVPVASLRDPQTDAERVINPEWLVVIGVCTHLGCVPLPNAGEFGGWFCPCHGSHYDISGRVRKGPAPLNLEVPQYKFVDDKKVLIG